MPHAIWALSLPLGTILIFVPLIVSKLLQLKSGVAIKNSSPREHATSQEFASKDAHGYMRRGYAAHQNSWEAMIVWSTAVLLANVMGVNWDRMDDYAGVWLAARVLYIPAYILIEDDNKSYLRSFIFAVGFVTSLALMFEGALKADEY